MLNGTLPMLTMTLHPYASNSMRQPVLNRKPWLLLKRLATVASHLCDITYLLPFRLCKHAGTSPQTSKVSVKRDGSSRRCCDTKPPQQLEGEDWRPPAEASHRCLAFNNSTCCSDVPKIEDVDLC